MSKSCKILLTGASGTIGREVLLRLAEKPDVEIFVFDKRTLETMIFYQSYKKKIHLMYGDLACQDDIKSLPGGFDVVIHLAAILSPRADRHPDLVEKVNVKGTNILINHLESTSSNALFLYSSCISVYGDRIKEPFITVSDSISPCSNDYYANSKASAEAIVQTSKLRWSIFRITAILKRHKLSRPMFHMPLDTKIETCSPGNAAQAFVNAIDYSEELSGRIFNVGGGEACRITYREFLSMVFQMAGLGVPSFPPRAFATQNYHSGFYADSDMLNNILHFRSDDLSACMEAIKARYPPPLRVLFSFLKHTIKANLLRRSLPYWAYITANKRLVYHYFGEEV